MTGRKHTPIAGTTPALEPLLDQAFPTSDLVLLCCFGPEATSERSTAQLRRALVDAGFTIPAARHAVRVSPILQRTASGQYRLRSFEAGA